MRRFAGGWAVAAGASLPPWTGPATRRLFWITGWSSGRPRRTSPNRDPGCRVPPRHLAVTPGCPAEPVTFWSQAMAREYVRFMVAPDSAPSDSLPSAFRASDEDRDEVIRLLRDGSVDGRISNETFLRRVDRALHARGVGELAELLSDLPPVPDDSAGPAGNWRVRVTA